jgi:hypothetical protein
MSIFSRVVFSVVCAAPFFSLAYANPVRTNISTCDQLQAMNQGLYDSYVLANDIECAGFPFVPVGTADMPFRGVLEGAGYRIQDISIYPNAGTHGGLFGVVEGAQIQNVGLENFFITATDSMGTLAGEVRPGTNIFNVWATGRVQAVYGYDVGGLVGRIEGTYETRSTIQNASTGVTVEAPLSLYVGGLVGQAYYYAEIFDSYAVGPVYGRYDVGGLVGSVTSSNTFSRVWATGSVDGEGSVGGLIGEITHSSNVVSLSYATGDVVVRGSDGGGLIGAIIAPHNNVSQSYATGRVTSTGTGSPFAMGGLIGRLYGTITDSYATGEVVSPTGYAGGLIGYAFTGDVINCYSSGWVGGGTTQAGGLMGGGSVSFPVTNSYWDIVTSGQSDSAHGTPKTTAEMYQQSTYTDWDFNYIWTINHGSTYPWLQ